MVVMAEGSTLDQSTARQSKVIVPAGLAAPGWAAAPSAGLAGGGPGGAPGVPATVGGAPIVNCSIQIPASTPGFCVDNFFVMESSERISTRRNSASTSPQ